MTNSTESMVATWSRWLFGPSLPLTMKYAHCMQYTIRHGKQDAKVIFDGYSQHLPTKPTEQAQRAPTKISESISMDRLRRQTFSAKSRKRSFNKVPGQSPDICLSRHSTSKIRCCFYYHIFCTRDVGCTYCFCCGKWHRLTGDNNYQGHQGCSTLHAPSISGNTTVFDITRLPNLVSECKNSLLSLHVVTGYDTTLVLYKHGKNKACKQRRYKSCKICIHLNHTLSTTKGLFLTGTKFCKICMVTQISPHWVHSDNLAILSPNSAAAN